MEGEGGGGNFRTAAGHVGAATGLHPRQAPGTLAAESGRGVMVVVHRGRVLQTHLLGLQVALVQLLHCAVGIVAVLVVSRVAVVGLLVLLAHLHFEARQASVMVMGEHGHEHRGQQGDGEQQRLQGLVSVTLDAHG